MLRLQAREGAPIVTAIYKSPGPFSVYCGVDWELQPHLHHKVAPGMYLTIRLISVVCGLAGRSAACNVLMKTNSPTVEQRLCLSAATPLPADVNMRTFRIIAGVEDVSLQS